MFGDLAMPTTEHSAAILAGSWPSQSVTAWSGYSTSLDAAARNLFSQLDIQHDIRDLLAPMDGNFIDAARGLEATRETALENRIEAYRHVSKQALWGANELHATKADLVEIVNKAEEDIHSARQAAAQAKAANPLATPQIDSQLASTEAAIVARATALARARDLQGAGTVAALAADIGRWTAPHKAPSAGGTPSPPAPQPAPPAPRGGGGRTTPVDHHPKTDRVNPDTLQNPHEGQQGSQPGKQYQESTWRKPETGTHGPGSPSPLSNTPGTGSSPSPGSSAGSGPGSMINSLMKPMTGGSSPASSAARGGGLGNPGAGSASSAGQLGNGNAASPSGAAAAGRGGGGASLAGLGSGIAEVSARAASGAISGAANGLGVVGNVGSQVAQNVAAAAAQAPAAVPAATPPPPAPPGGGAGPPMAMMPPPAGGPGAVTPVGGGPGGPASPPAPAPPPPGGAAVSGGSPAGPQVAPMVLSRRGTRGIGADGASGDALVEQAMDVGQAVIASMLTQTLGVGYIGIDYAVSLISERTGSVSAWLATSEGASYIPLGVRVPADVRLALTDPVIGHDLFEKAEAAGGANALEVVVRHAEAREMAAPGTRVLVIASSLPMEQMVDWAAAVGARPVSVLAEQAGSIAPVQAPLVHRCAVAMPWEWRQANAFNDQQRLQVAARHMHMAALAGHLHGAACESVMRQFELRQPIEDSLWDDVRTERFMALVDYELEMQTQGQGGSDPARLLASARAAEVIECLRNYDTVEGCADLLYAARLAGAPLNPVAAVV